MFLIFSLKNRYVSSMQFSIFSVFIRVKIKSTTERRTVRLLTPFYRGFATWRSHEKFYLHTKKFESYCKK